MLNENLEFVAEEWVRLAADRAKPLGLPTSLLAREFMVVGMHLMTNEPIEKIRRVISEEMAEHGISIREAV
jgi:hypothetical protein